MASFPFLFILVIYLAIIGFIIWFCRNLIQAQRDRNQVLREISTKLDGTDFGKKEDQ
ncbi:hypothetical protein KHA94_03665 [Bacillus sp. FJAT-49705]|uniref:DUF4083 domain-containing protein n=1 Tax=Cytobacillus citreus TaxID=2833586 RepID=A0ABS5NQY4_9BACI|nr:hypothetical protein [Cytobacillus citreus]MBS4189319.1 hypothetical protein [Cytobacillus citreus]